VKSFIALVFGLLLGAAIVWYFVAGQKDKNVQQVRDSVAVGAEKMKEAVKQGIDNLKTEDIKEELERTGTVVRRKAEKVGAAIADAAANAKITAAIKAKLAVDSQLSSLKISVDTTDGLVTLSGSVGAYDEIGKAIRIALETDGVRQVVSTLQVKPSTKPN